MSYVLKKTVVLVGMMGSGKSAVGSALARLLDVEILDSDAEIETAANMSIAEIFERDGEPFFRSRETEVISRLMKEESGILSTGGGAFLTEKNRQTISSRGIAVWLRADIDLLWARVRHRKTRPLLVTADPRASLQELCLVREPEYAHADLVVDARSEYSIEDMAYVVIDALLTRPDVLERR